MVPALRELIPSGTLLAGSLGIRVKLEGQGRRHELVISFLWWQEVTSKLRAVRGGPFPDGARTASRQRE